MQKADKNTNRRILVIDDNPAIHEDYRKILSSQKQDDTQFVEAEEVLFGESSTDHPTIDFQVDSAFQGEQGLEMVKKAISQDTPYAMAYVDMRMPPGWDGLETIQRIWEVDPRMEIVICSAYSDHSWQDITRILHESSQLLILKKPFDNMEVLQLASALTEKWELARLARLRMDRVEQMAEDRSWELLMANQNVNQFMSNISHELLTPLNGIVGTSEVLRGTELDEDQQEYLDMLTTSTERLTGMLQKIIDYNELQSGRAQLEITAIDLKTLCRQAMETVAGPAKEKNLELMIFIDPEIPDQIWSDPRRVRSVLVELANNAVKFTESGHVSMEVRQVEENADQVSVSFVFSDTGIGVPDKEKKRLQMNFSQADGSETREFGGIGIGLTLARQIVSKLGGSISIESEEGQGAKVSFTLQFDRQEPASTTKADPDNNSEAA